MKKRLMRLAVTCAMTIAMLIGGQVSTFAAAPVIEDIDYNSKGRVEVEFYGKVQYRNLKVSVKDTSGKKYSVKSVYRDNDEVEFTIKNFKKGKTYNVTVSGVKKRGTGSYGKVSRKFEVPKPATGKAISAKTALSKAKSHASKTWKAKSFWDVDVESDRYRGQAVWEVSFNGIRKGSEYEFEYKIAKKGGKILWKEMEWDD